MTLLAAIALICVALPLAGWIYQLAGLRRDALRLPPPGEIRGGIHIVRRGHASTPIVLEAGIAATSLTWARVVDHMPDDRLIIAYDRPGFGWSSAADSPRTLDNLAADLGRVLDLAGIHEPAILVGHSFGGLLVRRFAQLHPGRVAALLLLDPLEPIEWHPMSPDQAARLSRGVILLRRGALLARFGVVRFALDLLMSGSKFIPKLLARASSGKGSKVTDRLVGEVRKMPPEAWPAVRAHWCLPRSFITLADYLERLPESCREAASIEWPAGLRVTAISAAASPECVRAAHAAHSTRHLTDSGSGHWIQLDNPSLVAAEILRLP
ncbi:MAG TPA: alpha/beta fold hydrolase [Bryobacteraceae bacterium]|nr:alpha/beta fold hydrolase [Bryobacteraceae bacterium]